MRLSFILLTLLLIACSQPAPVAPPASTPPPTLPPRFVNFETGANVKSLAFEGDDLWLGLASGLIRYDTRTPDRHEIFTVRSTQGLLAKGIYKVSIDPQGRKWVGTYGGGLSRFDGREWVTYTPYGGGRITYDAAWTVYPAGNGLGDLWVYDIYFDPDGTAWIATWDGVSRFDGKTFKTYHEEDGLLDKWVYAIAKDHDGNFWFGTEGGINRFDGKNWTGFTHRDGLGAEIGPPAVARPKDESYEEGHHGRGNKENQTANPNFVLDIAVDRENHIWAGTDRGVSRFDGRSWRTYTTADGLQDNNVFSIAFDAQGNKWFGTWTGLSKMTE